MPPTAVASTERSAPEGSLEELRDRIQAAYRAQFPDTRDPYSWSHVVGTFPAESYVIVCRYTEGGERYFRHDYTDDGESITFGAGTELELVYVPADVQAEAARAREAGPPGSAGTPIPAHPSSRRDLRESASLAEATRDGNTLHLTVIAAGFNTSRSRFYTEEALRDSGPQVFRGLKMYADHATAQEERERPEGSLRDWVASLVEVVYDAETRRLRGTARIVDPAFAEKVEMLDQAGLLSELGVSIRAVGAGVATTVEGAQTFRVDEFTAGRSVDFVTEPGAGGHAEFRESEEFVDLDTVDAQQLRERRPDLVEALLQEGQGPMTAEELAAAQRRAAEAEERAKAAEARATAAEEAQAAAESALEVERQKVAHREAQEAIGKLIAESKLPAPSQAHLRKTLAECADVEEAKAAIESHTTYLNELTGAGVVRGNGATVESGSGSSEGQAPDLKSKFARFGLSEAAAERAAVGR